MQREQQKWCNKVPENQSGQSIRKQPRENVSFKTKFKIKYYKAVFHFSGFVTLGTCSRSVLDLSIFKKEKENMIF